MILYSHRSKLGVSVAATSVDGILKIAIATTHSRLDAFSRARARQILDGRLKASTAIAYRTDLSTRDFMNAFKAWFKPTPDESDNTFPAKISKRRDKICQMILEKADDIIAESALSS